MIKTKVHLLIKGSMGRKPANLKSFHNIRNESIDIKIVVSKMITQCNNIIRMNNYKREVIKMTNKEYIEKMEYALDETDKAVSNLRNTVSELKVVMNDRTSKIIKRMFEIFDTPAEAVSELLDLGYTKSDIRNAGYDIK